MKFIKLMLILLVAEPVMGENINQSMIKFCQKSSNYARCVKSMKNLGRVKEPPTFSNSEPIRLEVIPFNKAKFKKTTSRSRKYQKKVYKYKQYQNKNDDWWEDI